MHNTTTHVTKISLLQTV